MSHRLKLMRKVFRKNQKDIADVLGIGQNTYSYWERGNVRVDNDSFVKLSEYYGVSIDFLSGRPYVMNTPPEKWSAEKRAEYNGANDYKREYMEYMFGDVTFTGSGVIEPVRSDKITQDIVIYHRNGRIIRRHFTPEQMTLLQTFLDALSREESEKFAAMNKNNGENQ